MNDEKNSPANKIVGSTDLLCCAVDKNAEPSCDLGKCTKCGWKGKLEGLELGKDGSWEEGYFDVPLCPICDDGGCIDEYDMSDERNAEWLAWHDKQHNGPLNRRAE